MEKNSKKKARSRIIFKKKNRKIKSEKNELTKKEGIRYDDDLLA